MDNIVQIEPFKIIGIAVQTTNQNGQAEKDLGTLWGKFYQENIPSKIPNKLSDDVYSIYTDYESDYKGKYTTIIGLEVSTLDSIPVGLVGRQFKGGKHTKFVAKGEMPAAVINTWLEIWSKDKELKRKYTADFEIHGKNAQNGADSVVEIFLATE